MEIIAAMSDSAPATSHFPLLEARGITRTFPGVRALDEVDFTLQAGEIHGLVGENGAGKSTLINVLSGVLPPDSGSIQLNGQSISPRSPLHAQQLGVSTVHQEIDLIPDLSIAENMFLGRLPRRAGGLFLDWKTMRRKAREALDRLHIRVDVTLPLRSCSTAIQQMIAIARAVDQDAQILILDEPTSSLDQQEVDELSAIMRHLKANGLGIIFISHFLDQIEAVCDSITVLRNGKRVGTYGTGELSRHELVTHMIGKELLAAAPAKQRTMSADESGTAPAVLFADGLGRPGFLSPTSLSVHQGESLGLAGLLGSGRSELAHLIFGAKRAVTGSMIVNGKSRRSRTPRSAIRNRIALVPEDRKTQGILPDLSVEENIVIAVQARRGILRPLTRKRRAHIVSQFIKRLGIATPDASRPIRQLSGGNQQKALLARWLAMNPAVLILDEPTRGIDVGAKAEVEAIARDLCVTEGTAIIFISSELDEVVRDSDRVIVMRDRSKVGELEGDAISLERIIELIAGNPHTLNTQDDRHG